MYQHPAAEWDASSIALVDEIAENDGWEITLLAVDQGCAPAVFLKNQTGPRRYLSLATTSRASHTRVAP